MAVQRAHQVSIHRGHGVINRAGLSLQPSGQRTNAVAFEIEEMKRCARQQATKDVGHRGAKATRCQ